MERSEIGLAPGDVATLAKSLQRPFMVFSLML